MFDRKARLLQKQVKRSTEEMLAVQEEIGSLLKSPLVPGDAGEVFRLKLLLNRACAVEDELAKICASLDEDKRLSLTRTVIIQNRELIRMQKDTLESLLKCMKRNNAALLEAKRAALYTEAITIGERIRKNGK